MESVRGEKGEAKRAGKRSTSTIEGKATATAESTEKGRGGGEYGYERAEKDGGPSSIG